MKVDSSQYGKSVGETSTPMVASELGSGVKVSFLAMGGSTAEDSTVTSASSQPLLEGRHRERR